MSDQQVCLTLPATPEFLRVARVTASGLASRLGFSIDEVDDLRLALDELCFALIGKGDPDNELRLEYRLGDLKIGIEGVYKRTNDSQPLALGELSEQILGALVDSHQLWDEDTTGHFTLEKNTVR